MAVCPICNAELKAGDPSGLCPACLLAGAIGSGLTSGETDSPNAPVPQSEPEPDSFGPYRILSVLGEGGMGTVYLAEQTEPIRRRVALKVVKLGMDTNQVLARFNHERRSLALMEHSNIARILDAGASTRGRPFFVMDYIDGESITAYCDRHHLTTAQRLELFVPICRAVQHAHNKGIIHRDIKPSNVLVTVEDGKPVPKVIDFGIARAIETGGAGNTFSTEFGQMVGTPEYASPEQADMVTGEIGAATDVYSLGVLLYELLVGTVPFDGAFLRKVGLAEMLRIIREEEAPSLVERLRALGPGAEQIAARRGIAVIGLRKLVDGNLDRIVRKALEKSPQQRYASPSELAADIERHLKGETVLALRPRQTRRIWKPLVASALAITAGALGAFLYSNRGAKLTDKDTIIVADFINKTGDPVFDETLRQGLTVELQQSPYLSLISDQRIQGTLRLMGQSAGARLTPELAREVCERTGGTAILEGSIAPLGSGYVLGLRARNCRTGDMLADDQVQAARKEEVIKSLTQIAGKFRKRVGESLPSIRKQIPLEEATTPSLEALKAFSAGWKIEESDGSMAAVRHYQRAIAIDPNFAMAHAALGFVYYGIGETELAADETRKAYQLRDRASDREKFFITYAYDRQVTGNLEKGWRTAEMWAQTFPRDPDAHGLLGGWVSKGAGRYLTSIQESQKMLDLDPNQVFGHEGVAFGNLYLERFPEAEKAIRRVADANLDCSVMLYYLAFFNGDQAGMDREVTRSRGKVGAEDLFTHHQAMVLGYSGHLREAEIQSRQAVVLARQTGDRGRAATYLAAAALRAAHFGNAPAAKQHAMAAMALYKGRDVEYSAAFALALSGDLSGCQKLAEDLDKRFPEDTNVQSEYLPSLRALLALAHGDHAKAIELLQAALPYDLALPATAFYGYFGGLYPAYVRGKAHMAAHQWTEAAAEFRKVLGHRGLVFADPIGALAHLELARALRDAGDSAKAKAAYQDFLTLWKDADADIPLLQQAKAEYARL